MPNHYHIVLKFVLILLIISITAMKTKAINQLNPNLDVQIETSQKPLFTGLQYGSYYKGAVCQPCEAIRRPKSVQELIGIVKEAIGCGLSVKALGFQHSATDVLCTDGIPISMLGILGMEMDPTNKVVTVGAGENMYSVTKFLRTKGRGLKTTPAFGNITIGGAIGTGSHGSSIKYTSSISEQVVGVEIIDGKGNLRTITDATELLAFSIHLGLLGIVTKVMLRTEPVYKVHAHNYVASDDLILNGRIIDIIRNADQMSVYWFPSFHKIVIANWTILEDVHTPGEAYTHDHVPSTSSAYNKLLVPVIETLQGLDSTIELNLLQSYALSTLIQKTPGFVPIYTEDGLSVKNPAVGWYDDMFAPVCKSSGELQCPWFHGPNNQTLLDNELTLPLDQLPEFAAKLKDITTKYPAVFITQGILLRFSEATETYMSTSQGRDSCHFEFYMWTRKDNYKTASSGLAAYQAILQTLAFEHQGRSHWGKSGLYYHTRDNINRKLDPTAKSKFISKMNEYDPNGVFLNDFGRRLKGTSTKVNFDPELKHCALLDNCVCKKSSDCAPGQFCGRIEGYPNYPVCKTPGHFIGVLNPNPVLNDEALTGLLGNLLGAISSE